MSSLVPEGNLPKMLKTTANVKNNTRKRFEENPWEQVTLTDKTCFP
jgi:hypothetical protein